MAAAWTGLLARVKEMYAKISTLGLSVFGRVFPSVAYSVPKRDSMLLGPGSLRLRQLVSGGDDCLIAIFCWCLSSTHSVDPILYHTVRHSAGFDSHQMSPAQAAGHAAAAHLRLSWKKEAWAWNSSRASSCTAGRTACKRMAAVVLSEAAVGTHQPEP